MLFYLFCPLPYPLPLWGEGRLFENPDSPMNNREKPSPLGWGEGPGEGAIQRNFRTPSLPLRLFEKSVGISP